MAGWGLELGSPYGADPGDATRLVGRVTAMLAIAAGLIHLSAAGDHSGFPVMVGLFMASAVAQIALGGLLAVRRPSRLVVVAGLAVMAACMAAWCVSRTHGLPFDEGGEREEIGFKDAVCVFFELAAVPGLLLLMSRDLRRVVLPSRLAARATTVAAGATLALMVPALALVSEQNHDEAHEHLAAAHHAGAGAAHHAAGHARGHATHAHGGAAHAAHGHVHSASPAGHAHTQLAALHTGHHVASGHAHAHAHHRSHHERHGAGHDRHGKHKRHGRHKGHHHRGGHKHGGHKEHPHGKPEYHGPGNGILATVVPHWGDVSGICQGVPCP